MHKHLINRIMTTQQKLRLSVPSFAANFPSSTASPSFYFRFPGCTPQSTAAVRKTIEDNDRRHDIYEKARCKLPHIKKIMANDKIVAHNHISHSLLTRYALGASPTLIEDSLIYDAGRHVSLDPTAGDRKVNGTHVPDKITRENWTDDKYLGQREYVLQFHGE